jgi:hypothetical protein
VNLAEAKTTLLVRAVETTDREGVLLPLSVRDRCTAEAGPPEAPAGAAVTGPAEQAFLARRAALVQAELERRHPGLHALGAAPGLGNLPLWIGSLALLVMGFLSAAAWVRQPLRLLNFPLLWLIAWNLLVYLWLLAVPWFDAGRGAPRPLVELVSRLLAKLRMPRWPDIGAGDARSAAATRAAAQFLRDWIPLQPPWLLARAQAVLHAGAVLLTLGAVIGLVWFGLSVHYRVGWESSWGVTAEGLHALLRTILAPAAWITPPSIAVMPTLDDVRAWSLQEGGRGGSAWDLVKLFIVAALLYVVLPRAVLWAWARRRIRRVRESFYVPPAGDRYYRRLLQAGRGAGAVAAVFFHGLEPTAGVRARLREALADELGGRVTLEFMPPVAYGDEAGVAATLAGHDERERTVAVFSLAATPEEEVQGELLRQLAAHGAADQAAPPLVVLDAAPLARFEASGGFRAHYEDRLRAWERFSRSHGVEPRVLAARDVGAVAGGAP